MKKNSFSQKLPLICLFRSLTDVHDGRDQGRGGGLGRWNRGVQRWGVPSLPCLSIVPGQFCGFRLGAGASGWRREGWEEVANSLFRSPTEDTGYQHLALVGGMAGWHRVGPLRGLLLIPVTPRGESRRCATENLSYGRVHATEVLGTRTVPFARTRSRS